MKQARLLLLLSAGLLVSVVSNAQVSGSVFHDFNSNGTKDANDIFVSGVIVEVYNAAGTLCGTATTAGNAAPNYTIPAACSGQLRVQFRLNNPASTCVDSAYDYSSPTGATYGSNVQFVTAPVTNVNYAISSTGDFYGDPDKAFVYVPIQLNGDPAVAATGTPNSFFGYKYNSSGVLFGQATDPLAKKLPYTQIGSLYGVSFSKQAGKIFTSAYLKRYAGLGPLGSGGIYLLDTTTSSFTVTQFYDMDANGFRTRAGAGAPAYGQGTSYNITTLTGADAGQQDIAYLGAIDPASGQPVGLGVIGTNTERQLTTSPTISTYDPAAFDQIGKVGIGDMDISDDGKYLFVMNLYDRKVYRLELNNAYNPTSVVAVTSYTLPTVAVTNGLLRPFALKFYKGVLYVGAVASGELGGVTNDLFAYVLKLNNAGSVSPTFSGSPILTQQLNYLKGSSWATGFGLDNNWNPWADSTTKNSIHIVQGGAANSSYPTPMFTDIEFTDRGDMILDFRDRTGDQFGYAQNFSLSSAGFTTLGNPDYVFNVSGGEILLAGKNCGTNTFSMESNGSVNTINGQTVTSAWGGVNNFQGIANGEFFQDEFAGHQESSLGSAAVMTGAGEIINTVFDPWQFTSNGTKRMSTTNGILTANSQYELYSSPVFTPVSTNGKSNSLGDIEVISNPQPIQIGNRIWTDTNGNGIQDANETTSPVPAGTVVTLHSPGLDGIYGNGDDQIWTTTTDAAGNYYFRDLSTGDNRSPNPATLGNTILPGFDYRIEVTPPAGYQLTKADAATNSFDNIDNDAVLNGAIAVVSFNTSTTNHNFDIGFKTLASLGDKVWRDDNKDGIQDAGEPGVAGVTVTLYNNLGAVVGTTVTDAYGNYLFDNLTPGDYTVGFTPPTNYTFTISSGTSEPDATNSDANPLTGRTTTVTLSAGENQRNIDAGLIFSQPATNSIGNRVWFDADGDGVQDANEASVSGVTVTLYAADGVTVIATTVTDANGNYLFNNLPPNTNYIVGITPPAGMLLTSSTGTTDGNATTNSDFNPATFKTTAVNTGAAGNQITGIDAGLIMQPPAKASLGDKVWLDLNNDGLQDPDEPGVPGVPVTLYAGDGVTVIATTVTDAFGNYIFNNLDAGAYVVGFGTAPGYTRSTNQNIGVNDFADNDANPVTGKTGVYNIVAGQRNMSVDAALVSTSPNTARLGDYVWFDANKDGIQDATETPVAGVTVTLYNGAGTAIGTTTTDANGYYQFTNLAAGTYSVGFSNLPAGYSFTTSTGTTTASNTTNSDVNPASGITSSFTLNAGESLQGLDAGLIAGVASGLGSLGNKIWYDLDGDGIQDADELGIPGITVTLLDYGPDGVLGGGDDGPSKTTTTNALGEYIFTGLPAGNYAVQFGTAGNPLPAGYTTNPNQGADDAVDSDGGAIAGGISTTGVYKLAQGEDNLTVDFGLTPPVTTNSLGNYVWYDANNNGVQDATEVGVAGVMVKLYNDGSDGIAGNGDDVLIGVTTTDANGLYLFAGLPNDGYYVNFSNLPAGYDFTTKSATNDATGSDADRISGTTSVVNLTGNTHDRSLDAGITTTRAALGNYVWLDDNGNGVQDGTEVGVPGVTVTLYRPGFGLDGIAGNADDALPVATMITDQNGKYLFDNLTPGTYEVEFSTIPNGLNFTQQNTPGDNQNNTNSDANPATGRTTGIVLSAGEVDLTVDAGLFKPRAVIGNYVWVDTNGNGLQDSNEPPASGIVVSLIDGNGNVVAVAITDGTGHYLFPNVAPGTYSLSFTNLPQGTSFTTPNSGGDDGVDSDVIGTTITGIVVTTTTNNLSFDAGIVGFVTLPVHIQLFAVKSGNKAILNWKVSAERDVRTYTLEHSPDGRSFTTLTTFNADGRSEYTNTDVQPYSGINYYRVKVENLNGSVEYSEIRLVLFTTEGVITVFPNPAIAAVNIQLPDSWQGKPVKIDLINLSGQIIISRQQTHASQIETINTSRLPAGIYNLYLLNSIGETETRKVLIL
jgi:protocatechuate 3,4-dioxygenase beta subunit